MFRPSNSKKSEIGREGKEKAHAVDPTSHPRSAKTKDVAWTVEKMMGVYGT